MKFSSMEVRNALEAEMDWEARSLPSTIYGSLKAVAEKHGSSEAITFQLQSGPKDPAETITWSELFQQTTQAANLFRSLGIGEKDVVAFIRTLAK